MGRELITGAKKLLCMKELYMEDNEDLRNTFIYNLSEDPGMASFKHVLLFHSSYDTFSSTYSSRLQSNKFMKYSFITKVRRHQF